MKIFQIFTIFINFISINSFTNLFYVRFNYLTNPSSKLNKNNKNNKNNLITFYKQTDNDEETKPLGPGGLLYNKAQGLIRATRPKNIIPTILLCFSGGWIINPSINLLHSTQFIVSVSDAVLIMSSSMILNDIYDIEIDKLNSPTRPLASGEIKISEAIVFTLFLIGNIEYLTFQYLPDNLKLIIQLIIVKIFLYTPVLKKIPFVKNISCATLVAFSLFFSGLASSTTVIDGNPNFGLLAIAMSLIFFGSWTNEILLDIRDTEGDKVNNIQTIPILFGKETSFKISSAILNYCIITNSLALLYLYNNIQVVLAIPIIFSSLLVNLQKIKKNNFSNESIVNYMKYSNYPLIILLVYLCTIASFLHPTIYF